MNKFICTILFLLLFNIFSFAQTPGAKQVPYLGELASAPTCPKKGAEYFNTTTNKKYVCTSKSPSTWVPHGEVSLAGSETLTNKTIDGASNTVTNATANGLRTSSTMDGTCATGKKYADTSLTAAREFLCYSTNAWTQNLTAYDLKTAPNPNYLTASGTNTYAVTLAPALVSYQAGQAYPVKFTNANSGAATINFNSLGAKSLVKSGSTALSSGDIAAGQIMWIVYDGTNFQIIGVASSGGGGGGSLTPITGPGSTILLPTMNVGPEDWRPIGSANAIYGYLINIRYPQTFDRLTALFRNDGASDHHFSVEIWNQAGTTKLASTGIKTLASGAGIETMNLTEFTLDPGTYYYVWTADSTEISYIGSQVNTGWNGYIYLNYGTPRLGPFSNTSTAGATPSTLGTISAAGDTQMVTSLLHHQ